MTHPDLLPAILARMHLNQQSIGEAFERLSIWLEQNGSSDTARELRYHVESLRYESGTLTDAINELIAPDGHLH